MTGHVLMFGDDRTSCETLDAALVRQGCKVTIATTVDDAVALVAAEDFDLVVTDLVMPLLIGLDVCDRLHSMCPDVPVVVITAEATLEVAIGAIRSGAYDFITKPLDAKRLQVTVARAIQYRRLRSEVIRLRESFGKDSATRSDIVGGSAPMRKVYDLIDRVGDSDASVLIQGETGTGKELIARAIHMRSRRREGPFVAINCAAVAPSLLESELFGHARGAFTDAKGDRKGLFVQANGGTLFLDEVGEMPVEMQPKLLRALQERTVRPVGGNVELTFDCRLVTATNRNLEDDVYEKRFREDFYYRINVVKIDLPPLRERGGDVLLLAYFFLKQFGARTGKLALELSTLAAQKLIDYEWPGNVRELENCMEHAVALARYEQITVEDLPAKIRAYNVERFAISADDHEGIVSVNELRRRYVQRVLALVGGNKSRAAKLLGIDRRTMYRQFARDGAGEGLVSAAGTESESSEPDHDAS